MSESTDKGATRTEEVAKLYAKQQLSRDEVGSYQLNIHVDSSEQIRRLHEKIAKIELLRELEEAGIITRDQREIWSRKVMVKK